MFNRLFIPPLIVLIVALFLPVLGASDDGRTAAERRLSDDLRAMPVPEDARFSDLLTNDLAMMMVSGGPTDDPQIIFPALRIVLYAVPRPCASLESFYQQHWEEFEFLVEDSFGVNQYVAFLRWQGDELLQDPDIAIEDIDDSAEGVAIMANDVAPRTADSPDFDTTRELYGFPDDIAYCTVFMINSRRVDLSDIPLSLRGLSSGDIYTSVTGLFNAIVPSAGNFFVNRYFVVETSEQQGDTFVEEVSFVIADFGEHYRIGVVRLGHTFESMPDDAGDELTRIPLSRHFQGQLPGEVEQLDSNKVATEYGPAVQALYRVEEGSQLVEITNLESPETSTPKDALVAVMAVPVGDYLIFSSAQNDFLANDDDQSLLIASIRSRAAFLIEHLTWSRDLPGDAELPASLGAPLRVPHLERCVNQFSNADGLAFENTCEQPIAFQIVMKQDEHDVVEDTIEPGATLRFAEAGAQYTFAACPSGYVADKPFDGDSLLQIRASHYNCSPRESGASSTE